MAVTAADMNGQPNDHVLSTEYGRNAVNGVLKSGHKPRAPVDATKDDIQLVLQSFRLLVADLCEQFNGGHPGGAIGMAAIGVALFKYAMKYAPHQPTWFNRDRFLLSNGHACLFQYINHYLAGYKAMTWDQLKSYHSDRPDALCPGHPEIEHEGIELTTGPLGQGIANCVGLAMATKHLAATYNRPGYEVVNNHTWCIVGDACLQEGIGCEAFSFAGHLKLNNLTVIYDNNQITCDGSVDLTNTEDVNSKMRAQGWDVIDIEDGVNDVAGIVAALECGRDPHRTEPLFINVRTIIGVGSAVAGQAVAHGAALGNENVKTMKKSYGWDPDAKFMIPDKVRKFYANIPSRGDGYVDAWRQLVSEYKEAYPELHQQFQDRMEGKMPNNWDATFPDPGDYPTENTATRKSSKLTMEKAFSDTKNFMVGTADLTPSVNMTWKNHEIFNPPSLKPVSGASGSYAGRYLEFGVREHLMAAVSNGLAAYNPGTIIPVTSSFFMFYLYAAPAVRMGALQRLQVIHVATHDSIGMGEDGPTHQPIELAALFRAMPNLLYIRPGDSEEVAGAWKAAVEYKNGPSIISVSRHSVPQTGITRRAGVLKGAYILKEDSRADMMLIGIGAELSFALNVAKQLKEQQPPTRARVISFPSMALFKKQTREYQRSVLRRHEGIPAIVIEPYASLGWERYADAGFTMSTFGHSLPGKHAYTYFGYETEKISKGVTRFVQEWKDGLVERGEWRDLLEPKH